MLLLWARPLGDFGTNCYVIACPETRQGAVVDPGQPDQWIKKVVAEQGLKVALILLTHGHVDHIGGVTWVQGWTGAPVLAHPDEVPLLADPLYNGSAMWPPTISLPAPDRFLREGDTVELGNLRLQVFHTPGHSPGGICFYTPGHLIAGDTLFAGSIGRTDFPGGDHETLLRSIREKLFVLPPETRVYPGHMGQTTIGDEQEYNPFVGQGS